MILGTRGFGLRAFAAVAQLTTLATERLHKICNASKSVPMLLALAKFHAFAVKGLWYVREKSLVAIHAIVIVFIRRHAKTFTA